MATAALGAKAAATHFLAADALQCTSYCQAEALERVGAALAGCGWCERKQQLGRCIVGADGKTRQQSLTASVPCMLRLRAAWSVGYDLAAILTLWSCSSSPRPESVVERM